METIDINGIKRPTKNADGSPIHSSETGIRNFWKWFGDSSLVDDAGRPLVFYHGTKHPNFEEFIPGGIGTETRGDAYGIATYFTTSKEEASDVFASNGAVFPVYARGNILNGEKSLSIQHLAKINFLANKIMLPSDKSRFAAGKGRREFVNIEEARSFFDLQMDNWRTFGDKMDRAKPEVVSAENGVFVIEYTKFGSRISISDFEDVKTLFSAIGWSNATSLGFDGVLLPKSHTNWLVMHNPEFNIKSIYNSGRFEVLSSDLCDIKKQHQYFKPFIPKHHDMASMKG